MADSFERSSFSTHQEHSLAATSFANLDLTDIRALNNSTANGSADARLDLPVVMLDQDTGGQDSSDTTDTNPGGWTSGYLPGGELPVCIPDPDQSWLKEFE
ncbi:MAG: hypothetical protein KC777_03315 [Cyanobacteria bacterium HKST-UBA02]|nr:hypothetical protein [Cyanobacteria bacterium HKST-UBA02]